MTMEELSRKFDELLRFQGHAVFQGYRDYLKGKAKTHAEKEFAAWKQGGALNAPRPA